MPFEKPATKQRTLVRPLAPGDMAGRYLVVEPITALAFGGHRYLAHDPQLQRKVMLTIVAEAGEQSHAAWALRAAELLARLDHPHVPVVYEVGRAHQAVFVATEFVDGDAFTQWLEVRPRHDREVLAMLLEVGRALAAAHAVGLSHGDLRLDAIVVGKDGRPRLCDFVLGRTREGPAAEDVFADIHAFCSLLHAALAMSEEPSPRNGPVRFFAGRQKSASIRRNVDRASTLAFEQRWESMDALLDALVRHDGETRGARRWIPVAAAGLFALSAWTVGADDGVCSNSSDAWNELWTEERRTAVTSRLRVAPDEPQRVPHVVRQIEDRARTLEETRVELCSASSDRAHTLRRLECLDDRRADFEALLSVIATAGATVPRVVAAIEAQADAASCFGPRASSLGQDVVGRLRVARAHLVLGLEDRALRIAEELKRRTLAEDPQGVRAHADAVIGEASRGMGRYLAAETHLREAFFAARRLGEDALAVHTALALVELVGLDARRTEEGLEWLEHAAAEVARIEDPSLEPRIAQLRGRLHARRGELSVARELLEQAHDAWSKRHAPDDHRVIASIEALAEVAFIAGDLARAEAFAEDALRRSDGHLERHPERASAWSVLAQVAQARGRFEEAEAAFERALAVAEALGARHPRVAEIRALRARTFVERGEASAAVAELERVLPIFDEALGPEHVHGAELRLLLGRIFATQGRLEDATNMLERAVKTLAFVRPRSHDEARARFMLAGVLVRQGRSLERARSMAHAAHRIFDELGANRSRREVERWLERHVP